jgi:hypothetical protein
MADVVPQQIRNFLATTTTCVVATTRPDGSVRQSVVYFLFAQVDGTDCIVMSTEAGRAKALDVAPADWITVTSSLIAEAAVQLFGPRIHQWRIASLSPVTSATLRRSGVTPTVEAATAQASALVAAMADWESAHRAVSS